MFFAGNVWLHFWPALFLIAAVICICCSNSPDKLALCTVLVPQIVCLLLSTTYHLFMAQVKDYEAWLRIDVRFQMHVHCRVCVVCALYLGCNNVCVLGQITMQQPALIFYLVLLSVCLMSSCTHVTANRSPSSQHDYHLCCGQHGCGGAMGSNMSVQQLALACRFAVSLES